MFILSTPVKIAALAALAGVLALGGFALLASHHGSSSVTVPPAVHARPAPAPHRSGPVLDAGLPTPVRRALLARPVAVAVVVADGVQADAPVLAAAREGARKAGAAFASLDVSSASTARALSRWQSGASDPAVLVVRRPGRVVRELDGWSDATMVAALVASAR